MHYKTSRPPVAGWQRVSTECLLALYTPRSSHSSFSPRILAFFSSFTMVPTFILTRTFAISALFVGAFPTSYAAPIPNSIAPRGCRQMSCLYALPGANADASDAAANTTFPPSLQIPTGGFSQESMQMLDLVISALTYARSAASAPAESAAEVQPAVDTVSADGFVPAVDTVVEDLAAKIASSTVAAEEAADPAKREPSNLDALV
ncbi:hypothetical protein C8Q80DRAFT_497630 [Daedaleopsis nitida]|nr:hypothetical protein C8Q80DRAFT_497630 [Daedaleopsis nitida]